MTAHLPRTVVKQRMEANVQRAMFDELDAYFAAGPLPTVREFLVDMALPLVSVLMTIAMHQARDGTGSPLTHRVLLDEIRLMLPEAAEALAAPPTSPTPASAT